MIRITPSVVVLTAGLLLASCGSAAVAIAIENEVQTDANLVCGFIPTIATIAQFIPGAGSAVPAAASIAEAICTAIAAAPQAKVLSARQRSMINQVAVNVAVVKVPGVGPVAISGTFTR